MSREPLVGTARNGQAQPGVFRGGGKTHQNCRRARPSYTSTSSSVFAIAVVAIASHPLLRQPAMRTQLVSTLLRARPATVSCVTPRLARASSNTHHQETFESFTERYVNFFQSAEDLFEVQRGLNNCFAHDLVPAPAVVESALRASRRVNDYATAVRIFEGIKEKVENKAQYQAYLDELKPVREELGAFLSRCESLICPIILPFSARVQV